MFGWKGPTLANPVLAILICPIWPIHIGPIHFWPIHFWPIHFGPIDLICVCVCVSWWAPKGGEPKISRFLFPSPTTTFALSVSLSLGVFSWNFGGFGEAPRPSNVHVWSSRVVV